MMLADPFSHLQKLVREWDRAQDLADNLLASTIKAIVDQVDYLEPHAAEGLLDLIESLSDPDALLGAVQDVLEEQAAYGGEEYGSIYNIEQGIPGRIE